MELKIFFHWSVTKSYWAVLGAFTLNLDIRRYHWHLFNDFHHWCISYWRKMPFIFRFFYSSHTVMIILFPLPTTWWLYLEILKETEKFKEGVDMLAEKTCTNWWMSPHGIIALLHLSRILVAGHVKDPSQSTSYKISCAKPGLDFLTSYYLAYSWFVFESTRKREALGGKCSVFPQFSLQILQNKAETCQRWQVFEPGSWSAQSTCPCWSSLGRWTWEQSWNLSRPSRPVVV